MLEFEEQRLKLQSYYNELCDLKDAIGYDRLMENITELENKAAQDGFWDDIENSQTVLQQTSRLKDKVARYNTLVASYDDAMTMALLADEEEDLS